MMPAWGRETMMEEIPPSPPLKEQKRAMTREEKLEEAERELQAAKDARQLAIEEAQQRLRAAEEMLAEAKAMKSSVWPKRKSILVGNYGDCGENLIDWAIEQCGFVEGGEELNRLDGILYECEVVFDIYEDGSYKLVGFWYPNGSTWNRELQGFGERGEIRW